jgi:HlyD family secretion protein
MYPVQQGRVVKVPVRDGADVKAGDLLLQVDDAAAAATLREAQAALQAAHNQLQLAEIQAAQHPLQVASQDSAVRAAKHRQAAARFKASQARRLADTNVGPEEDAKAADELAKTADEAVKAEELKLQMLQALKPDLDAQRAKEDVNIKQALVDKATVAVKEHTLRAPGNGKVLRVLVNEGETLGANPRQPALVFCPEGPLVVRAEVEQEFADRVVLNQKATIQDDTRSGPTWSGKVTRISDWFTHRRSILLEPLQFNDVRTLECIIEVDGTTPLRIGQRVRVTLEGLGN